MPPLFGTHRPGEPLTTDQKWFYEIIGQAFMGRICPDLCQPTTVSNDVEHRVAMIAKMLAHPAVYPIYQEHLK